MHIELLFHHECYKSFATIRQKNHKFKEARVVVRQLIIYFDNVRDHSALSFHQFCGRNQTTVLIQPPYAPDLVSCDFFLFGKLKSVLKNVVSTTLTTQKQICQRHCRTFQKSFAALLCEVKTPLEKCDLRRRGPKANHL